MTKERSPDWLRSVVFNTYSPTFTDFLKVGPSRWLLAQRVKITNGTTIPFSHLACLSRIL